MTRTNSVQLFKAFVPSTDSDKPDSISALAVDELLNLPKTGKTAGPDHRVALYSMLAFLSPSPSVSTSIVQSTTPLLAKETHEAAVSVLTAALPAHIVFLLKENTFTSHQTTVLIAKEMGSSKLNVKRAFCILAGTVFFGDVDYSSGNALEFAKALAPSLENSLRAVSGNVLTSSSGPLEGYIAVSALLGPLSKTGKFGMSII